jgi:hypothetical protein
MKYTPSIPAFAFTAFLSASLLFSSCSKTGDESEQKDAPVGVFNASNTIRVLPAEMYTANGRVSDASKVQQFVNRKGITQSFIVDGTTNLIANTALSLEFGANEDVKIKYFNQPSFSLKIKAYDKTTFAVEAADSASVLVPLPGGQVIGGVPMGNYYGSSILNYKCDEFLKTYNIAQFDNRFVCKDIPAPTGYSSTCKYKMQFPVEVLDNTTLQIPMLFSFYTTAGVQTPSNTLYPCRLYIKEEWNILNRDFFKNLKAGDTVLVQRREIHLKKAE